MPKIRIKDLESSNLPNNILATDANGLPYYFSLDYTTLVSPVIHPTWTIYKDDGVTLWVDLSSSTSKNITVEKGCRVVPNGYFVYPTAGTGQSLPIGVSGSWGTTLPSPNVSSGNLYQNPITVSVNTSYGVSLTKPKTGLSIVNSQVVLASGNDTTNDSMSVTFLPAGYFGPSPEELLTSSQIQQLGNKLLQSSKVRTIVNFSSEENYTYYCYPATYGDLNSATQNGALAILGAFDKLDNVMLATDSGVNIDMIVYRSNAINAFTNATISFT